MLERWGYGGVFIWGALDRITVSLIPTEVLLPLYGFLVAKGAFGFWLLFGIINIGALTGELVLFGVATKVGREVVERWGKFFLVTKHELEHLDRLFDRHGAKIVFLGRFLPVVRAIVAIPAGIAGISWRKFAIFSFLGMLPYNFLFIFLGLKLGENVSLVEPYLDALEKIAWAVLAILAGWYVYRHIGRKHATH